MKTILEILSPGDVGDEQATLLQIVDEEIARCKSTLDLLGMGEWYAAKLAYLSEHEVEAILVSMIAVWASPVLRPSVPTSIEEFLVCLGELDPKRAALSFGKACLFAMSRHGLPEWVEKLAFRLEDPFEVFDLRSTKLKQLPAAAATKLEGALQNFHLAINSFLETTVATPNNVKTECLRIIRTGRSELKRLLLPQEEAYFGHVETMLGPQFRMFCDACENRETARVLHQAPALREAVLRSRGDRPSTIWLTTVQPIAQHILKLIDEVVQTNRKSARPSMRLATTLVKLDLSAVGKEMSFSCRLLNEGDGQAYGVALQPLTNQASFNVTLDSPQQAFDLPAHAGQVVTFTLVPRRAVSSERLLLPWTCSTLIGELYTETTTLDLEQQAAQPDWDKIRQEPPYTLKPIKHPGHLFGRAAILEEMLINAAQSKRLSNDNFSISRSCYD